MSFLFGSSPQVKQLPPQPTVNPTQDNIINALAGILQQAQGTAGATQLPTYPDQTVAGQTQGQGSILDALLSSVVGAPTQLPSSISNLVGQLPGLFQGAAGYQAPQVTAPQVTTPQITNTPQINYNPTVPTIDATQAFQQGVVTPVTQNFQSQVIPSLNAAAGRSAGGIYSSDNAGATEQALKDLDTTLTGAGSQFAYNAAAANQGAQTANNQLLAQIANENLLSKLGVAQSNLGAETATNALNTGSTLNSNALNTVASLQGQGLDLSALAQLPGTVNTGLAGTFGPSAATESLLTGAFPTISSTQATQQTGLQQLIDEITKSSAFTQNLEQIAAGLGTAGTQQGQTVVQGGSTGLLQSLLGGLAGNTGIGNAIGTGLTSLFSDKNVKQDIKKVGRLDKTKLPVYTFRYRGEPTNLRRIGLLAQDVEKTLPEAVGAVGPFKTVDYASVALAEAFPDKRAA